MSSSTDVLNCHTKTLNWFHSGLTGMAATLSIGPVLSIPATAGDRLDMKAIPQRTSSNNRIVFTNPILFVLYLSLFQTLQRTLHFLMIMFILLILSKYSQNTKKRPAQVPHSYSFHLQIILIRGMVFPCNFEPKFQ